MRLAKAILTPGLWASDVSGGKWRMARHLVHLDRAIMRAITTPDSRTIVTYPPRHGKSEYISKHTPAWFLGRNPEKRVLLCSYESDFAGSWGRRARQLIDEHGADYFGVEVSKDSSATNRWELARHGGGMQTAGIGGPITGKGADLMVIDDYCKNYEQAHSRTWRDATWEWWTSTAYTRLEPGSAAIVVATRWHYDDLIGRILEHQEKTGERWELINFPALAEDGDPLGREPGEALWPERYSAERLQVIRRTLGEYQWNSLYQQRPAPREGGMFKRDWFRVIERDQIPSELWQKGNAVRFWDCAATHEGGDYSVGVLMAHFEGLYYVLDVCRGQWSTHERKQQQQKACSSDSGRHRNYRTWQEREPGSSGKDAEAIFLSEFAQYGAGSAPASGSKEVRAMDWAAECEAGNVVMVEGHWNREFVDEHCAFPHGANDDQVDASAGSYTKLRRRRSLVAAAV